MVTLGIWCWFVVGIDIAVFFITRYFDAVYCGGGFGVHFESIGGHAAKTAS